MVNNKGKMRSRWIVALPAIVLFLFSVPADASGVQGLEAVGYVFDDEIPVRSSDLYPSCGSEIENNINRNFDYEPFQQCPDDLFLLHYSGFITVPEHETVQFWLAHDDGATLSVGDAIAEEWWLDTGCSWSITESVSLPSGVPVPFDSWMYERGGNSCYMLAWSLDGGQLTIVPDWAFTTQESAVTTSTSTSSSTTTTVVQVPVQVSSTTTTDSSTTTTSTSSSSTTTSTVFYFPEPDTTEPALEPISPSSTTTSVTSITLPPITITDDTTVALPDLPSVDIAVPEQEAVIEPVITEPTPQMQEEADNEVAVIIDAGGGDALVIDAVTDLVDAVETPQEISAVLSAVVGSDLSDSQFAEVIDGAFSSDLSDEELAVASESVFADIGLLDETKLDAVLEAIFDEPLSDKAFDSVLEAIFDEPLSDDAFTAVLDAVLAEPLSDVQFESLVDSLAGDDVTDEQISGAVEAIVELGLSADESLVLALSEDVLDVVSETQAEAIFDALVVEDLSPAEELLLVTVLSGQPDEIKDVFEDSVNVYSEGLDEYVPAGSFVDVGTRRALVAVSGMVGAVSGAISPTASSGGGKKVK